MDNPYLMRADYVKLTFPWGGKSYRAQLHRGSQMRVSRRVFKRAAEAQAYAILAKDRWIRLYDAAVAARV